MHQYEHLKHIGPERGVSIHVAGSCPDFKPEPGAVIRLGAHGVFLEGVDAS